MIVDRAFLEQGEDSCASQATRVYQNAMLRIFVIKRPLKS